MKKTGIVIGVLFLLVAGIVAAASMQPDEFRVERSAIINASPSSVFAEINDLRRWEAWSPWAKMDPEATSEFSGASSGEGSTMAWDGNHKVGKGSMTIEESRAPSSIKMRLDFLKPMESTSQAEFTLASEGNGTRVTWAMYGANNFMGKVMSLVMDCEKMVGGTFEEGLANLKTVVETK